MPGLTRERLAWGFYDWANSAFATTILAFIFVIYFVKVAAGGFEYTLIDAQIPLIHQELTFRLKPSNLWPLTVLFSLLIVTVSAPVLGAIADRSRLRKRFLYAFCYTGAISTMLLFFVGPGQWYLGILFFTLSNIGFVGGNVFYNSLLKDVASNEDIGFVSGLGWGMGYIGGFLLLALNLTMVMFWKAYGFHDQNIAMRTTFLTVGIWWAVFSIPLFLLVKERKNGVKDTRGNPVKAGFKRVAGTFMLIRSFPTILLFLVAFFFFNDAIQTTISQASNFGINAIHMTVNSIILAGVIVQLVAIFGSFGFMAVEKRLGTKRTLMFALAVWVIILSWAVFMRSSYEFYAMSIAIGMVMGVSQSASRTLFGRFTPSSRSSEFFSFYSIFGKASSLLGPALFAAVDAFTSVRYAVIPLCLMMLLGLVLLFKVDVKKGEREAAEADTLPSGTGENAVTS